ncbi:ribosomal protein S14p/S29e [Ancylostoma duodenale]|uniref:Small ribosomal subunit protein uS14 n=1 Tax=Ancylostoma duodenale TaxID=51022 RepID=A0A0C2G422_9BILA|nr:ribosomal protein S14p/S29e [Ancylostoma duodenale]
MDQAVSTSIIAMGRLLDIVTKSQSPRMGLTNLWFSHPRKFSPRFGSCCICSNHHGLILKYGLDMCQRCFREYTMDIGFKKFD